MYNLLEYSKNYRKTTGTFWNYCSDGTNDFTTTNYNANPIKKILNLLNIKQQKHQMQIMKTVKTLRKKMQRLKKIFKSLFH